MLEYQFFCVWRGAFWVVCVSCQAIQASRWNPGQLPISGLQNALGRAQYDTLSVLAHSSKKLLKCIFSPHHGLSWPDIGPKPICPCAVGSWLQTHSSSSQSKWRCVYVYPDFDSSQTKLRTWSIGENNPFVILSSSLCTQDTSRQHSQSYQQVKINTDVKGSLCPKYLLDLILTICEQMVDEVLLLFSFVLSLM